MTRAKRDIRMTDEEWEGFKRLLGPEWLRAKVRRELAKEKRQAKCVPDFIVNLGTVPVSEAADAIKKIGESFKRGGR